MSCVLRNKPTATVELLTALVATLVRVVSAVVVAVAEILFPDTSLSRSTATLPRLTRPGS